MTVHALDNAMLAAIAPLRGAGFALHWLRPRDKAPIGANWAEAPVLSAAELLTTHRTGNNLGVRLGEPSVVSGSYLHLIDLDIRVPDLADEAWAAFADLFPELEPASLPCVQSGSGGESRHLYLLTDKPFRSKRLAVSPGKHRRTKAGKEGWSYDWEIELFGTGKQVVLPPSIHPDTGRPYIWLREFDFTLLDFNIGPFVPAAAIERLAVAEHATYQFETREPLTFSSGQLERTLDAIKVSDLHYDDWIRLGQALHHQFGGSEEGFQLWLKHTQRSTKFTGDKQAREMRRVKWKSFGRYRGQPVTMASIVEWAKEARVATLLASFDDDEEGEGDQARERANAAPIPDLDDILGGGSGSSSVGAVDPIDALGGEDVPVDIPADDPDEIDAIGTELSPSVPTTRSKLEWVSLLQVGDKGYSKTLHNIELIVKNDPRMIGLPQLNEFTGETVQRNVPGVRPNRRRNQAKDTRQLSGRIWEVRDTVNGDNWSSARDYAVRSILEAPETQGGYGITVSDRDLNAATVLSAWDNAFHPVREYLIAAPWDGKPRLEQLFIDFLGAPDNAYYRDVARLMMVAAVARVFEPGCKWDTAVILEGEQGRRKSTFIRTLGRRWFSELDGNFHDSKEMVEKMQGSWILEMPELSGFHKAEVQSIKAFISRQTDKVRLAYEKRAIDFHRQSILIGSTNDREYLRDNTGGRRFLPVECRVQTIDIDALQLVIDQMWGEAYALYREMRRRMNSTADLPLYLTDEFSTTYAAKLQESRRVESPDDVLAGRIEEWLEKPISTGSLDDDGADASDGPVYYNEVCTQLIWVECLGGDIRAFKAAEQGQVNRAMGRMTGWGANGDQKRFPKYGKQRVFYRGGEAGKLARMGLSDLI